LSDQLSGIGGGRSVGFGPNKIRSLPDAVAKALMLHMGMVSYQVEGKDENGSVVQMAMPLPVKVGGNGYGQAPLFLAKKADICPSCGEGTLTFEEGCKKCYSCGYSEC